MGANHDVEKVAFSLNISSSFKFSANEASIDGLMAREKKSRNKFYDKVKTGVHQDLDKGYFDGQ